MESLMWWDLTNPFHLIVYGMRHCSPSTSPIQFLLIWIEFLYRFNLVKFYYYNDSSSTHHISL